MRGQVGNAYVMTSVQLWIRCVFADAEPVGLMMALRDYR